MSDVHADRVLRHELITLQREEHDWGPEGVWALRQRLHVLHDHHRRSRDNGHAPAELAPLFDELLAHTADLWSLQQGLRETGEAVGHNHTARWLGAAADASGMLEEILTGEDPGGEALTSALPFALHRAGETAYIRSAEVGYQALAREHTVRLADALWRRRGAPGGDGLARARGRRAEIDGVLGTLRRPELAPTQRLALMALIYRALIRAALRDLAVATR